MSCSEPFGENPDNRDLVFSDKINRLTCPQCGRVALAATSLMYTNADLLFAVWYEPEHDQQIDDDNKDPKMRELVARTGATHLLDATRVPEWEQFKEMIRKYERGELVTEAYKLKQRAASSPPTKRGCMGVVMSVAAMTLVIGLIFLLVHLVL